MDVDKPAMVITDNFIFIHQPKTGGTFVREAIDAIAQRELHGSPSAWLRRIGILPRRYAYLETAEYHDRCRDVPPDKRELPILSIVRNPLDYYVSFYHFGWWASHPEDSYPDIAAVKRAFPNFPDLSFDEFLILANTCFNEFGEIGVADEADNLGYYSTQFVLFYFRDPSAAYPEINDAYLRERRWQDDMFDVHFMRTHNLNADLHAYLATAGYEERAIDDILGKAPVRPAEQRAPRPGTGFLHYYSDSSLAFIRRKERLLFAMFEDLDGR